MQGAARGEPPAQRAVRRRRKAHHRARIRPQRRTPALVDGRGRKARAASTVKLLIEAREHLLARAEEIRGYDRRINDIANERDALQTRVSDLETDRLVRESEFKEVDQARATLLER